MKGLTIKSKHAEKLYKAGWHAMIALVGVYELRNHKTLLSKILAVGLISFHADAAICDYRGTLTTPQKLLKILLDK